MVRKQSPFNFFKSLGVGTTSSIGATIGVDSNTIVRGVTTKRTLVDVGLDLAGISCLLEINGCSSSGLGKSAQLLAASCTSFFCLSVSMGVLVFSSLEDLIPPPRSKKCLVLSLSVAYLDLFAPSLQNIGEKLNNNDPEALKN